MAHRFLLFFIFGEKKIKWREWFEFKRRLKLAQPSKEENNSSATCSTPRQEATAIELSTVDQHNTRPEHGWFSPFEKTWLLPVLCYLLIYVSTCHNIELEIGDIASSWGLSWTATCDSLTWFCVCSILFLTGVIWSRLVSGCCCVRVVADVVLRHWVSWCSWRSLNVILFMLICFVVAFRRWWAGCVSIGTRASTSLVTFQKV